MLLCELLTLTTPFVERDSLDQTNCHQKTFANIVQGKYSKNWEQKAYRRLGSRAGSVIDGLLQVLPPSLELSPPSLRIFLISPSAPLPP